MEKVSQVKKIPKAKKKLNFVVVFICCSRSHLFHLAACTQTSGLPELPIPFGCIDVFFPGHGSNAIDENLLWFFGRWLRKPRPGFSLNTGSRKTDSASKNQTGCWIFANGFRKATQPRYSPNASSRKTGPASRIQAREERFE
jgi:hypothetical protein